MTLSIKNGGYGFLIRLDLTFSMSLWNEPQFLQILNDLSIKHLIKLILHENDVELLEKSGIGGGYYSKSLNNSMNRVPFQNSCNVIYIS